MESRFFVEAKVFSFSVAEGKPKLCVEERRRGFLGSVFLGPRGVDWLLEMLEELLRSSGEENFLIHPSGIVGSHCQEGWK